ncbi:uncharacterized protein LOC126048508 isoform X6 [Accipiter gentilis]|uniref:uncharacterized protein LOC126048508 isoform X6 n=1 Tax=Astur gentilis TaxID=8957 RepID=UPI0021105327|nr:uncharacterized protein LOC126048508 isoform X6 [Accipiter gentilis]
MDPAVLLGAFPGTRRPTAQPRHGARSTRERGHKGDFFQREDRVIKSQDHDLLFSFMKRWSRLWVALTRILELHSPQRANKHPSGDVSGNAARSFACRG